MIHHYRVNRQENCKVAVGRAADCSWPLRGRHVREQDRGHRPQLQYFADLRRESRDSWSRGAMFTRRPVGAMLVREILAR
jgi:hypothetical protein